MDQLNWYFKQRVSFSEMQDAFTKAEAADHALLTDLFTGGFLIGNVTVVEDSPQSQEVQVGAILAYDNLGQRVVEAAQNFSFVGDDDPGLATQARLYVKFTRDESDPVTDGLNNIINFTQDEGAVLERDLGTPGGGLPALRVDESILLANINIPAAAAVITNADIDATVQNLQTGFSQDQLSGSPIVDGYLGLVKLVALSSTTIDVERASGVGSDGVAATKPDTYIKVVNQTIDVTVAQAANGRDYAGAAVDGVHYVYLIGDTSIGSGADSVIASLDPGPGHGGVGPTLPGTYDRFRLIGMFNRQAGAILPFRQIGEEYIYDDAQLQTVFTGLDPHGGGAGPTAYSILALSPYVSPIAERAYLSMTVLTTSITGPQYGFRSRGGPAIAGWTNIVGGGAGGSLTLSAYPFFALHVDASEQVDWNRETGSAGPHTTDIYVIGMHLDLKHEV